MLRGIVLKALRVRVHSSRLLELLLLLLLGLTPLLWYGQDTIVFGHDTGFPLDPPAYLRDWLYTWTDRGGLGYSQGAYVGVLPIVALEALVDSMGFSLSSVQKITFSFWFVAPGLAMYALLSYLDGRRGAWVFRLTGSILYMFNHFLLQAWFVAERPKFTLVAALPLVLLLVIRVADGGTRPRTAGLLIGLILGVFNGAGLVPYYAAILLSAGLAVIYYGLVGLAERREGWIRDLATLVGVAVASFALVNAYWVLPQIHAVLSSYGRGLEVAGGIEGVLGWADGISARASVLNLLRLQGMSAWYGDPHPYSGAFLNHRLLIGVSALLPLLAFAPLLRRSRHVVRRHVLFFALLALVGMIFTGGTHPPLGFIYRFLLEEVPGFAVFRSPYYKFAPALLLPYAVLVALSMSAIVDWAGGRLSSVRGNQFATFGLGAVLIGSVLAYDYPIFSGAFFKWQPPLTTMVRVPDHVFEFGRWADSQPGQGRVLLLPPLSDADAYDWGYMSLVLVPSYFAPTLADTPGGLSAQGVALVDELYSSLRAGDTDAALDRAAVLGIQYFLLRNDVIRRRESPSVSFGSLTPEERPIVYEAIVRGTDDLLPAGEWGEWSVFKIAESRLLPYIYAVAPQNLELADQDRGRASILAGRVPARILFQQINPTRYRVQVRDAEYAFMLVFSEQYSEDWKIYQAPREDDILPVASYQGGEVLEGEALATFFDAKIAETWRRGPLHEDHHMVVNGYANGWFITNSGSYDLIIEYSPQRRLQVGMLVTALSVISIIGYLAAPALRRRGGRA